MSAIGFQPVGVPGFQIGFQQPSAGGGSGWRGLMLDALRRRARLKPEAPVTQSVDVAELREMIAEARTRIDYRVIAQPIVTDLAVLAHAMRARQLREELAEFEALLEFIAELREELE